MVFTEEYKTFTPSQRSFLRMSNNVSETSQNTLFPIGILCRPLATYYPAPQIQLLVLALYKSTYTYLLINIVTWFNADVWEKFMGKDGKLRPGLDKLLVKLRKTGTSKYGSDRARAMR